jgi:hypothetical protein
MVWHGSETDKSVPIYHAYNHHYFGWLVSADAEVTPPTSAPGVSAP